MRVPLYSELLSIKNAVNRIQADISVIRSVESVRYYNYRLENNPRYKDPRRLQQYAFSVNSQNGEDGIIQEVFKRIGMSDRVFVEVGVGNGTENNTAFLLSQGWKGYWIDGSDAFLRTVNARRDLQTDCLMTCVNFVNKENVVGIFKQLNIPTEFDLLSLDVDQNTYYIWEALHEFKPRVVVIEYNASIPPEIDWKVHYDAHRIWDGTQNFGASLKAYEKLGVHHGYSLVGCDFTGSNAFFVRDDLVAGKFAELFTAENHFEPPRYGYFSWRGHRQKNILDR